MKVIAVKAVEFNNVDNATIRKRWSDYKTSGWDSTIQGWRWDEGDALLVATGDIQRVATYIVLRIETPGESRVQVFAAQSISDALKQVYGLDTMVVVL